MKIISTIFKLDNLMSILENADGIIVGNSNFSARLTSSFSIEEINDLISKLNQLDKSIFLNVNQMFSDDQLDAVRKQFKSLNLHGLTGIVVADLGVFRILKQQGLGHKVVYNPETLLTNYYDFNFLASEHVYGAYIAKEITLADIMQILNKKSYKTFMVGHGHLNMFYSKRKLIDNFSKFIGTDNTFKNQQNLTLTEEHRQNLNYPVFEDEAGTHVFRPAVFETLSVVDQLERQLDYLVVDTIFKDDDYAVKVLKMYHNRQLDLKEKEQLEKDYHETWDDGFLYKKTIYKTRGQND
ncbi:MAG: U32 family peptidase [Acholeplasmataceae bacterium]